MYGVSIQNTLVWASMSAMVFACGGGQGPTPARSTKDAKTPDAKSPDAESPDAKTPDAKTPDAKTPDAKSPDVKTPDAKTPTPAAVVPVSMPAWVGWPADPKALQAAIDARDAAPLREHAWRLWAGINQPTGPTDPRPLWWTWPTTTQLFESGDGPVGATPMPNHRHAARKPAPAKAAPVPGDHDHTDECYDDKHQGQIFFPSPTYVIPKGTAERFGLNPECAKAEYFVAHTKACSLADGAHFQSNGDIMIATESYSSQAAQVIEAKHYNQASTLAALLDGGTKILPDLPVEHIVTKHMFWPVKATGLSALPVYRDLPREDWCRYNGYETWDHLVAVDPSAKAPAKGEVDFLFGVYDHAGSAALPTKHVEVDVVPLGAFYSMRLDAAAWGALDIEDKMLLDAASEWAHGSAFEPGDYVVSVAMHIITKEIPQWTLQSAWWSDEPNAGPYAANRPSLPEAVGPWSHYLMTTADGIPTAPDGPTLPVSFNPFIELAATHPVATNCRNCHTRAAWCTGQYLTPTGPGPLANIDVDDALFAGQLLTDFQWVIGGRVTPCPAG